MTDDLTTSADAVLVVEPDDGVALPLRCGLERAGHPVERVSTGMAALDRLDAGGVALVVLDSRLPDMQGEELAGRIAAQRPDQHVLVMTQGPTPTAEGGPDRGVAHLAMPFSLRDLLTEVHTLIGHAHPVVPEARSRFDQPTSPCRGTTAETVVGQVPQ